MWNRATARAIIFGGALLLMPSAAPAQGHQAGQGFMAARVGTNLVGNTYRVRDTRPVPGGGGSLGAFLSPTWALEFETWVRASNPDCCASRGRETLFSLSVVRLYARSGLQPYALGGVTLLRSHGSQMQVQVGVGAQAPIFHRLSMAIDLRGNGGGATMIVRPTVAAIYYFR